MEQESTNLGANIKRLREERGISQEGLAKLIPISRPSVSAWEQGKGEPSIGNLVKISKILNVSLDMLAGNAQHSKKVVVLDTSVLMKRPMILDELVVKFDEVIIPDVVIAELNFQKNKVKRNKQVAWLAMSTIEKKHTAGEVTVAKCAIKDAKNDERIFAVAVERAQSALADRVYMLSEDIDFAFFIRDDIPNLEKLTLIKYGEKFAEETPYDQIKSQNFFSFVAAKDVNEARNYYNNAKNEIDINFTDPETGYTPLIQAVRNRQIDMVKFLVGLPNIDLNRKDRKKYYFTALLHAAQIKAADIFTALVENGADCEVGSDGENAGNTPLMVCAWGGFTDGVICLLENHPDICVNQQDSNGFTALIKACIKKNYDIAMLLVDGTDITIRSRKYMRAEDYIDFKDKNSHELLAKIREKKKVRQG